MWYAMTKFSFDPEKSIFGPFKTEDEAWDYIDKMADNEYQHDVEENGWDADIEKDKDAGEIVIKDYFDHGTDVMELFIFEMEM